jgi:hypothetical protein
VKIPLEVRGQIACLGRQVVTERSQVIDVTEEGAVWLRDKQPMFAQEVLADWCAKQIRRWIYQQTHDALAEDGDDDFGQLQLPFPELHAHLEVQVGVLKHQMVMNGPDWDNALAFYRNRRDQAEDLFRRLERRYHQIRHLLGEDLTTADVIDQLGPPDARTA